MKIPVVKTDVPLDRGAKEKIRMEIEKAIKTGIVILDGGLDLAMIEVDESENVNKLFAGGEPFSPAEGDMKAVIIGSCVSEGVLNCKEPEPLKSKTAPLLQIELDDIDSAPRIFYEGKRIDSIINADFSFLTNDDSTNNPTHIDIEYFDKECKFGTKAIVYNRHFKRQEGTS
ncbi:hypothetical protein [Bacillus velezensis]|uniref:hypothetical protein n=1 Tax=Bacillus velezensis TaxID=492670 RepID=UPI0027303609|nr:hypothetical protein [Bacillus velezensis]MDP1501259.1 hypothetical protein [Bacillus velezensis]MDP1505118.1 hypothetical protein [Bacillus velezensis]